MEKNKKESIIIIPGSDSKNIGKSITKVVQKISKRQTVAKVINLIEVDPTHHELEILYNETRETKKIDVFELFWGDIINENDPSSFTLPKQFIFGIELFSFWWFSPVWKNIIKNKLFMLGLIVSSLIILLWFLSISGLFITTFLNEGGYLREVLSSFFNNTDLGGFIKKPLEVLKLDSALSYENSSFFAITTLLLGILPTAILLRVSGFAMKYIKSNIIRDTVKIRIQNKMNDLLNLSEYEKITLFCHSMGAVPTINYLSDFENDTKTKIKCVSIGAPLSLLSKNSKHIQDSITNCSNNKSVDSWVDFFSKQDWMCSYERVKPKNNSFYSEELTMDSSWLALCTGEVHNQYFDETRVNNELLK